MKSWVIVAVGLVTAIAFVSYGALLLLASWPIEDWSIAKASLFGDSFGVLNSFFTGGAFLLILWTIVLQQQELRLQRKEMSRMVAAHQRELHMELLNYAFKDEELAKVWGDRVSDANEDRQYMYVNLIMSMWSTNYSQDLLPKEPLKKILVRQMRKSEYFRRFWEKNKADWREFGKPENSYQEFCDFADAAYEAAAADIKGKE